MQISMKEQIINLQKSNKTPTICLPGCVKALENLFPNKFYIGGSFAYKSLLGLPIDQESDIDFFTNVQITRTGFLQILETLVFNHYAFTVDGIAEDAPNYDMVDIRKVVKLRFAAKFIYPDIEFVFLPEGTCIPSYLMGQQATSLSECYLKPDFSPKGFAAGSTVAFKDTQRTKKITVNEENKGTVQHLQKIANLCDEFGFTIK
jgi:hypothetical protein